MSTCCMTFTSTLCPISIKIINTPTRLCYYTVADMWGRYYAPISSSIYGNPTWFICSVAAAVWLSEGGREAIMAMSMVTLLFFPGVEPCNLYSSASYLEFFLVTSFMPPKSTRQIRSEAKTIATEMKIGNFTGGSSQCLRFMRQKNLNVRSRMVLCQQLLPFYEKKNW